MVGARYGDVATLRDGGSRSRSYSAIASESARCLEETTRHEESQHSEYYWVQASTFKDHASDPLPCTRLLARYAFLFKKECCADHASEPIISGMRDHY